MAPPLLSLQDIRLGFGGNPLFQSIDLSISKGERICLVGRNGCGKSTLMKVMSGIVVPDEGKVWSQPGLGIAYLVQEPDLSGFDCLRDFVAEGAIPGRPVEPFMAEARLLAMGLDPDRSCEGLSGGESRRAALARVLASDADILLLDEPTNHLDIDAIGELEQELAGFRGALVVISHDRAFLSAVTNVTLWLDRGVMRRNDNGYEDFELWSVEVFEQEAVERAKLDKLIAEETRWSREGISARRTRNQGRLRRLYDLRETRAAQIRRQGVADISVESGESSGKRVIEAKGLSKAFGDNVICKDFDLRLHRGDKVGLVGPNGAGKSTLLKMLTGKLDPDSGEVTLGTKLNMVYLDQGRSLLKENETLWETLCPDGGDQVLVGDQPRHVVAYLRDFLFNESQARSPVSALSGGERNRLLLAKTLAQPSNFLILDEPTNDLDLDTLDLLQEILSEYDGTLMLVSHDRDFLDRVVTSTIAVEGNGSVTEYAGGYSDYKAQKRLAAEEAMPAKEATAKAAKDKKTRDKPAGKPAKLSYKDQRALDMLPKQIEDLEAEIATLEAKLADGDLYAKDPADFQKIADSLAGKRDAKDQAEEQWLELEMKLEELQA